MSCERIKIKSGKGVVPTSGGQGTPLKICFHSILLIFGFLFWFHGHLQGLSGLHCGQRWSTPTWGFFNFFIMVESYVARVENARCAWHRRWRGHVDRMSWYFCFYNIFISRILYLYFLFYRVFFYFNLIIYILLCIFENPIIYWK